jgi:hypothetical protein
MDRLDRFVGPRVVYVRVSAVCIASSWEWTVFVRPERTLKVWVLKSYQEEAWALGYNIDAVVPYCAC